MLGTCHSIFDLSLHFCRHCLGPFSFQGSLLSSPCSFSSCQCCSSISQLLLELTASLVGCLCISFCVLPEALLLFKQLMRMLSLCLCLVELL